MQKESTKESESEIGGKGRKVEAKEKSVFHKVGGRVVICLGAGCSEVV